MSNTMPENNLYASSNAASSPVAGDETYQPQFLSWSGRIGRVRYLAYGTAQSLLWYFGFLLASIPLAMLGLVTVDSMTPLYVVIGLAYLVLFVGQVSLARRRIHDLGQSSWWLLLWLVPLVNFGLWVYLMFFPGSKGSNRFGAQPAKNGAGVILMAFGFLMIVLLVGGLAAIAIPQYQSYVAKARAKAAQQQGMPVLPDASEAPPPVPETKP